MSWVSVALVVGFPVLAYITYVTFHVSEIAFEMIFALSSLGFVTMLIGDELIGRRSRRDWQ